MRKLIMVSLVVNILLIGSSVKGEQIIVEPDDYADGTVINNPHPDITLTTLGVDVSGPMDPTVLALDSPYTSTGDRVFGHLGDYPDLWGDGYFDWLRVDIAGGAIEVSIDFIASDGSDTNATLKAWDALDNLVDTAVEPGPLSTGQIVTLTVSNPDIAYVTCEGDPINQVDNWALDNLVIVTSTEVAVDIKPTSCPNPLNVKSQGVLPVAILGTDGFDVSLIDPDSVLLAGVAPLRFDYEDVATPFDGELCDCHEVGPDGYPDMTLKFDTQEIVDALGLVVDGEVLSLLLTGFLDDGTPIEGSDCIRIIKKGRN